MNPDVIRFRLSTATNGLLAALAFALVSFGVSARAADGPYVGIGGGLSMLNDSDVTAPARGPYPALNAKAGLDAGFVVKGTAGYALTNGLRVEGEIGYRKNNLDDMNVKSPGSLVELAALEVATAVNVRAGRHVYPDPATTTYENLFPSHKTAAQNAATGTQALSGDISVLTFMGNVSYDFDLGLGWKPYVGGGLGVASISLESKSTASGTTLADDKDTVFAYQAGGGVGYEFATSADHAITVSLDWRYFRTADPTFKGAVTGAEFDAEIGGHEISLGLRYGF